MTILLFNTYSCSHIGNQRQIKIKPFELINQKHNSNDDFVTIDEELTAKQNELNEINRNLAHSKEQSMAVLAEAQEKILKEKRHWEEEKKQLIVQSKDQGYKEGFSAGKQESLNQHAELLSKANEIVDAATKDYHATLENSEEVILMLAIQSAEKVIQMKLEEKPETFVHIIRAAIKGIKEQSMITIYLHPDNYQLVLDQKDELSRLLDSDSKLSIYAKEGIKINDCLIEHPFGRIDASIDTQLKQLRAVLHEVNMENKQ